MPKMLVAVDGSENSARAVDYVIRQAAGYKEPMHVHLLNVQPQLVGVNVKMFISEETLKSYYHDEGTKALEGARKALSAAGLAHTHHIGVGEPGSVTVEYVIAKQCDHIVMGTRGLGPVTGMILGSVATKVIHLSPVPVILVK